MAGEFKIRNGVIVNNTIPISGIIDDDTLSANLSTNLVSERAIKGYVDGKISNLPITNLSGVLTEGNVGAGLQIKDIANPTDPQDAATKDYIDTEIGNIVFPSGTLQDLASVLTVDNDGGAKQIKNILDPTEIQDAATKNYVDTSIAAIPVPSGIPNLQDVTDEGYQTTNPLESEDYIGIKNNGASFTLQQQTNLSGMGLFLDKNGNTNSLLGSYDTAEFTLSNQPATLTELGIVTKEYGDAHYIDVASQNLQDVTSKGANTNITMKYDSHPIFANNEDIVDKLYVDESISTLESGVMLKSVYDTNGDGVVDNSTLVNNLTVETAVPNNAIFTDTASNWTETDINSKAYIHNKPIIPSGTLQDLQSVTNEGNMTTIDIIAGDASTNATMSDGNGGAPGFTMTASGQFASILFDVPNSQISINHQLTGGAYITPNDDKDYIQKKYVDDEIGNIVFPSGTLQDLASVLTVGNDGGAKQIKNILDPTDDTDAVTKEYVDALIADIGILSARYKFSTSLSGDPTTGHAAMNDSNPANASEISINHIDQSGHDRSYGIGALDEGDYLALEDRNTSDHYTFKVTGKPVDQTGWSTIAVTPVSNAGLLNNNENITVELLFKGAKTFDDLNDTPNTKIGSKGKTVIVNDSADALVYGDRKLGVDKAVDNLTLEVGKYLHIATISQKTIADIRGTVASPNYDPGFILNIIHAYDIPKIDFAITHYTNASASQFDQLIFTQTINGAPYNIYLRIANVDTDPSAKIGLGATYDVSGGVLSGILLKGEIVDSISNIDLTVDITAKDFRWTNVAPMNIPYSHGLEDTINVSDGFGGWQESGLKTYVTGVSNDIVDITPVSSGHMLALTSLKNIELYGSHILLEALDSDATTSGLSINNPPVGDMDIATKKYVDDNSSTTLWSADGTTRLYPSGDYDRTDIGFDGTTDFGGKLNAKGLSIIGGDLTISGSDVAEANGDYNETSAGSGVWKHAINEWYVKMVGTNSWYVMPTNNDDYWNAIAYKNTNLSVPIGVYDGYNSHSDLTVATGNGSIFGDAIAADGSIYASESIKSSKSFNIGEDYMLGKDINGTPFLSTIQTPTDNSFVIGDHAIPLVEVKTSGNLRLPECEISDINDDKDVVTKEYLTGFANIPGNVDEVVFSNGNGHASGRGVLKYDSADSTMTSNTDFTLANSVIRDKGFGAAAPGEPSWKIQKDGIYLTKASTGAPGSIDTELDITSNYIKWVSAGGNKSIDFETEHDSQILMPDSIVSEIVNDKALVTKEYVNGRRLGINIKNDLNFVAGKYIFVGTLGAMSTIDIFGGNGSAFYSPAFKLTVDHMWNQVKYDFAYTQYQNSPDPQYDKLIFAWDGISGNDIRIYFHLGHVDSDHSYDVLDFGANYTDARNTGVSLSGTVVDNINGSVLLEIDIDSIDFTSSNFNVSTAPDLQAVTDEGNITTNGIVSQSVVDGDYFFMDDTQFGLYNNTSGKQAYIDFSNFVFKSSSSVGAGIQLDPNGDLGLTHDISSSSADLAVASKKYVDDNSGTSAGFYVVTSVQEFKDALTDVYESKIIWIADDTNGELLVSGTLDVYGDCSVYGNRVRFEADTTFQSINTNSYFMHWYNDFVTSNDPTITLDDISIYARNVLNGVHLPSGFRYEYGSNVISGGTHEYWDNTNKGGGGGTSSFTAIGRFAHKGSLPAGAQAIGREVQGSYLTGYRIPDDTRTYELIQVTLVTGTSQTNQATEVTCRVAAISTPASQVYAAGQGTAVATCAMMHVESAQNNLYYRGAEHVLTTPVTVSNNQMLFVDLTATHWQIEDAYVSLIFKVS